MKKKSTVIIGMVVCFMMMATGVVWAGATPILGVDNVNGTVKIGNLVWLKDAGCLGKMNWNQAMARAQSLKSGECGLTDGSTAGQWRLPNIDELQAVNRSTSQFSNVQKDYYWTSTVDKFLGTAMIFNMGLAGGKVWGYNKKSASIDVWPVRSGQ